MLVAGGGRVQSHFLQRQADLAAGVFAFVQRSHVQIAALIAGLLGGLALHVGFEQVELAAGAHFTLIALILKGLHGFPQIAAKIALVGSAVHVVQFTEETYHTTGLGPPRQNGQGRGVRFQQQVLVRCLQQSGGIERNAVCNGTVQFPWHDGNIFHISKRVAKGHANEFYVIFLDEVG